MIFKKIGNVYLVFSFFALLAVNAQALNKETLQIFDKENREFEPPPKSLRSDRSDIQKRRSTTRNRSEEKSIQSQFQVRRKQHSRKVGQYSFSGDRIFGVGFVGAGSYGIFGMEFDFSIQDNWTLGFGLGTGMSYSTWGLHSRLYIQQGAKWSSFAQFGYANWYMGKVPSESDSISPKHLAARFLADDTGTFIPQSRANIVYPALGVLYQHASGLAASMQLQYMIHIADFSGGLFGALGFYYYF